jgi:serine/threonine protein kinase
MEKLDMYILDKPFESGADIEPNYRSSTEKQTADSLNLQQLPAINRMSTRTVSCRDIDTGTKYAIKRKLLDSNYSENEVIALRKFSFPYLQKLRETFKDDKYEYIVTDWIDGITLEKFVESHGGFLSTKKTVNIAIKLCNIIEYFHDFPGGPFVYLDLKPSNILVDNMSEVYLTDLESIIKVNDYANVLKEKQTVCIGTKLYSAPETFSGNALIQSDIFSIGAIIYYLISGMDPKFPCKIPGSLGRIIECCTQPVPALRYEKISDLRDKLALLNDNTYHISDIEEENSINVNKKFKVYRRSVIFVEGNICFASELAYCASKICGIKTAIFESTDGNLRSLDYYIDTLPPAYSKVSENKRLYMKNNNRNLLKSKSEWADMGIIHKARGTKNLDVAAFDIFDEYQFDSNDEIRQFYNWSYNNYDLVVIASNSYSSSARKIMLMQMCDTVIAAPQSNIDEIEFCMQYFKRIERLYGIAQNKFKYVAYDYHDNSSMPEEGIILMTGPDKYLGKINYDEERALCRNRKGDYFHHKKYASLAAEYSRILKELGFPVIN